MTPEELRTRLDDQSAEIGELHRVITSMRASVETIFEAIPILISQRHMSEREATEMLVSRYGSKLDELIRDSASKRGHTDQS